MQRNAEQSEYARDIDVVVRCRNEMPYTARMLESLLAQRGVRARILFIDCRSTDGSREAAVGKVHRIVDMDPSCYVPGTVLNLGMHATESDVVAFINADAVPLDADALSALVEPLFCSPSLAATFARQLARPDADALVQRDYARAFPVKRPPRMRRGQFFSMAASAISRSAWQLTAFDESLKYSEDVDWTQRVSALGWGVRYVPTARFEHSHDYDLEGYFRRHRGEGVADTQIYHLGTPRPLAELAKPWLGAVWRDLRAGDLSPASVAARTAQVLGYYRGRRCATAQY
jgi:rhamnosyltransferase